MSIWSRLADVVSDIGDSIATFLSGVAARDPSQPETSLAFTIGMIALGAKMAKADGVVTGDEVRAFKQVFEIPPQDLANVARVFNLAKQDIAGFDAYARQLARLFAGKPQMLEAIIDSLFHIAKADGALHERESHYLEEVAAIFGFDLPAFRRIRARHIAPRRAGPWIVLGIDPSASDAEIRSHYRHLVRANHPDRQIAAGMPEEMVVIATDRLATINAAYDAIARERGL